MPYLLPEDKTAVFFSPKVAGTSIRAFMFELENGFPFRDYRVQGKEVDANTIVRNQRFNTLDHAALNGWTKIAIARDPIRRLVSAYSNRVIHYRELSVEKAGPELNELGLSPDPDIEAFFAKIRAYRKASGSIVRHTNTQIKFLGPDKAYFDHVFPFEELSEFTAFLQAKLGRTAEMPRLQTGGPKLDFFELPQQTQMDIVRFASNCKILDWFPHYRTKYQAWFDQL